MFCGGREIAKIPLHTLLDDILGFSIRDMILETPEDFEKLDKLLDDKIKEFKAEEAKAEKKEE